jgi:hypothetical protein
MLAKADDEGKRKQAKSRMTRVGASTFILIFLSGLFFGLTGGGDLTIPKDTYSITPTTITLGTSNNGWKIEAVRATYLISVSGSGAPVNQGGVWLKDEDYKLSITSAGSTGAYFVGHTLFAISHGTVNITLQVRGSDGNFFTVGNDEWDPNSGAGGTITILQGAVQPGAGSGSEPNAEGFHVMVVPGPATLWTRTITADECFLRLAFQYHVQPHSDLRIVNVHSYNIITPTSSQNASVRNTLTTLLNAIVATNNGTELLAFPYIEGTSYTVVMTIYTDINDPLVENMTVTVNRPGSSGPPTGADDWPQAGTWSTRIYGYGGFDDNGSEIFTRLCTNANPGRFRWSDFDRYDWIVIAIRNSNASTGTINLIDFRTAHFNEIYSPIATGTFSMPNYGKTADLMGVGRPNINWRGSYYDDPSENRRLSASTGLPNYNLTVPFLITDATVAGRSHSSYSNVMMSFQIRTG